MKSSKRAPNPCWARHSLKATDPDPTATDPAHLGQRTRRRSRGVKKGINRTVIEWVVLVVAAIVIAIVIKSFLFQAFYIPSRSMVPTLEVGDRVLVNKLSYDLHDVNRGDIVVFEAEPNADWRRAGIDDLVKRIIALPGETVTQCEPNRICVDGRLLNESYLPKGTTTDLYHGVDDNANQPEDIMPGSRPTARKAVARFRRASTS